MSSKVNYGGLVVAGTGFFLTRFTVTLALYEDPVRFYLAGILPLVMGLGLAAFGVALTFADVDRSLVRTTAVWCVVGAGTMVVLVVVTLLGSTGGMPDVETVRSQVYLSNFLIGGSLGGTFTGLYAARNRRQREEITQQANRLKVLNRLLRHEVLNAVTVIQGVNRTEDREPDAARETIDRKSDAIVSTIEEVKYLARRADPDALATAAVDLREAVEASVATVEAANPEASIDVGDIPDALAVRATGRIERAVVHLLEHAIAHEGVDDLALAVTTTASAARVSVRTPGATISEGERRLLETGEINEFDDPGTGLELNLVRLYVENLGGSIATDVGPAGTTVTLELPLARDGGGRGQALPTSLGGIRPALPHLAVTFVAAVAAAVVYGLVSEALGGSVAGIGVFYGTPDPVVGWITHVFHSAVFAFVFTGLVSVAPERYRSGLAAHVAVGLGWAVVLWLLAAGVVAPVWLRLLGIPADLPNLSPPLLVSHLAWGLTLGVLAALAEQHVTPRLGGTVAGATGDARLGSRQEGT